MNVFLHLSATKVFVVLGSIDSNNSSNSNNDNDNTKGNDNDNSKGNAAAEPKFHVGGKSEKKIWVHLRQSGDRPGPGQSGAGLSHDELHAS